MRVAEAMSSASANDAPAKAVRRKRRPRHPPPLDEVEPGRPNRNEGVLDTWVRGQPVGDRATQMAGQVIGDEREGALRIGLVERLQQGEVATRVARRRGLREDLAVAHA